jgi:hypothetical protein
MSKDFKTMSVQERQELVEKIGNLLVECDLGNVNVETYRDCVCALSEAKLE